MDNLVRSSRANFVVENYGRNLTIEDWFRQVVSEEMRALEHAPGPVTIYDKDGKVVEILSAAEFKRSRRAMARSAPGGLH